jgi:sulfate transport system permease protein
MSLETTHAQRSATGWAPPGDLPDVKGGTGWPPPAECAAHAENPSGGQPVARSQAVARSQTDMPVPAQRGRRAPREHWFVRSSLTLSAVGSITLLIVIPVAHVFYQALAHGIWGYWENLVGNSDTLHSILLTLTVAPVAVAANLVFGVAAAWAIARFRFPGRTLLTTLIDLPFSVSPVVAGLVFVLLFGLQGFFGPWLRDHGIKIIFATPGLILATAFVTFPFVARELIPVLEAVGPEEELAALSLGATGWQMFWRVTLPNIKWGVMYGIILCNARAMGEFGAVYVVSGHIARQTDTMPLRVEKLFQEYNTPGAFAVASVLTSLALVTLVLKVRIERKSEREAATLVPVEEGRRS